VVDWRETGDGSCLEMSAVAGVPASELSGSDLLNAWPSIARQIGTLHELRTNRCPFDRSLSFMFDLAADIVARDAVNPEFLQEKDRNAPAAELLARFCQLSGQNTIACMSGA
jgi:streptomycin 3"-kinase